VSTQPRQLVLATSNAGKLAELHRILDRELVGVQPLGLDDVVPYDEPAETGSTFEENALIKARAAADATGTTALADDSGICVGELDGKPGVLSARWAGPGRDDKDNNALLLAQTAHVPEQRRGAEFRCAMALVVPGGETAVEVGVLRGRLLREPRGIAGFGYDPLFVADGQTASNGELSAETKDAISHRGRALRAILPALAAALRS